MTERFRRMIFAMFGGRCAYPGCPEEATEVHHALIHNTKPNKIKFPLLLKSLFIFRPVCHNCNSQHTNFWNISNMRAAILEEWLREFNE